MSINFPNSPTNGTFFQPAGGYQYVFMDGVWRVVEAGQNYTALPRNRVVNGAMQISQEWGNTTVGDSGYPVDQWRMDVLAAGASIGNGRVQVVTPKGSQNRMRFNVVTGKPALAAGDYHMCTQMIEGLRVSDFGWGTASARQVVLRFGWKAPAGTYSISIANNVANRCYVANFTISAAQANTDTEQVIIIPGDTTGTWLIDTGRGLYLRFVTAVGTTWQGAVGWQAVDRSGTSANTNGIATAGNVIELFDVGLYLDPLNTGAPPRWEMPDEADELLACKRYYLSEAYSDGLQWLHPIDPAAGYRRCSFRWPSVMRIAPAVTITCSAGGQTTDYVTPVLADLVSDIGAANGFVFVRTLKANARM